jgi:uncharacterized protein (UPF0333 family)
MKLNKKGDLSLRYIILAALGLMVLVVITLIFLKGTTFFTTKLNAIWNQIIALKPDFSKAIPK